MLSILLLFTLNSAFAKGQKSSPLDIRSLPRLSEHLPPGTLAWASPDQLHPTQPQTGATGVEERMERYLEMLPKDDDDFPEKLYEYFLENDTIVPIYLGPVPRNDTRADLTPVLGYATDRTHRSNAISRTIRKAWGRASLSEPKYDKKGRPLGFILVRVMENKSQLSVSEFITYMTENKKFYFKKFERAANGETTIRTITFDELPEKIYGTEDNPFRDLVRHAQDDGLVPKVATNYSQFKMAEALVNHRITSWDEIVDHRKRALERAAEYFRSESGKRMICEILIQN